MKLDRWTDTCLISADIWINYSQDLYWYYYFGIKYEYFPGINKWMEVIMKCEINYINFYYRNNIQW